MKLKGTILCLAAVLMLASQGAAEAGGGLKIGGSTKQRANVGIQTSVALGSGAKARNAAASVVGKARLGRVNLNATAGSQTSVSLGRGAKSGNVLGSVVGPVHAGNVRLRAHVGNQVSVGLGGIVCVPNVVGSVVAGSVS